jgi:SAM-dependent methyltransferase
MSKPGWMIDELAYAGEEHLDVDYVTGYDQKSQTDHSGDLEILLSHGLNADSVVVDLGAGTGTFAFAVAPHCRRVVAADVSPAMLTFLRLQIEREKLANVEVVHAGLLGYEHEGAAPDFVYSRNTLHHLPDFWKALAFQRIAGLLAPGGTFLMHDLIYSFEPHETEEVFARWLGNAAPTPNMGFTREDLETHIREECSTFSWLLEPMLERAGFEIREAMHRPSRTYAAYVCVKR